jgi:trk system potassium uptake protein TrkH
MKWISRNIGNSMSRSPGRISILGYAFLIGLGTILLLIPVSTNDGHLSLVEALFTASSAVCVTGLTVVDTSGFTLFGKTVILVLIQAGGIGIMVLSTILLFSIGKKVSLTGRILIGDTYNLSRGKGTLILIKDIILFTVAIESIGAAILFTRFYSDRTTGMGIFYSVFHSVSAFCNAGFSLFPDSFTGYTHDWILNLTISALIILGGIGFVVLSELKSASFSRRWWSGLSLHTKLVLSSTILILFFSTVAFFLLEWQNSLKGMTMPYKFLASFFQAVNARTAGFNTVKIGELTNETLLLTIILMFIGTAPGSCGGGIKVTTFSTMIIFGVSRLIGQESPQIFYRRISDASIAKAVSLIMVSIFVITIGIILLQQTELGEVSHQLSRGAFLELMFENISAFGTVGLSTGVTSNLSVAGKLIITMMMFVGRLGPLVIAIAVSRRGAARKHSYAQDDVMIG